jgi:hypothetical protein
MQIEIKTYPLFELPNTNFYIQPKSIFNDLIHDEIKTKYYNIWNEYKKDFYDSKYTSYRISALYNYLNKTLDEPEFKSHEEQVIEIKNKIKQITQPSKRCKYEVILDELNIESNISNALNYKDPEFYIIKDLNNFVLLDLYSLNLDPRYFGYFNELIVSSSLVYNIDLSLQIKFDKNPYITDEIYEELYKKICNKNIQANVNYHKYLYKSEFHYYAFYALINQIDPFNNPLEIINSYLKLITKLNENYIIESLHNYSKNLFNNKFINETFGNNLIYQYKTINGFIDLYSKTNNNIIDIKTSNRDLIQSEYTINMKSWFKQLNIYNHELNMISKKYIIFNPLSNMICIWK